MEVTKDKIKFYKLKYKNKRILLGYCDYENFQWVGNINGKFIICISKEYSKRLRSIILHKYIKKILNN